MAIIAAPEGSYITSTNLVSLSTLVNARDAAQSTLPEQKKVILFENYRSILVYKDASTGGSGGTKTTGHV